MKSIMLLVFMSLFVSSSAQLPPADTSRNIPRVSDREGKFSIFTVVKFDNAACTTSTGLNGTCFTAKECTNVGGSGLGTCASGFGVCCLLSLGCDSSTSVNNTYFTGLSTLGTGTGFCQHTINKISSNVCQIRLDFDQLVLGAPDNTGNCNSDKLIVTGSSLSVPSICGSNAGQHIYLHTGMSLSPVTITISAMATFTTRAWMIRSSQICCDSLSRAPDGCLQYYVGSSGTFQSFNWQAAEAGLHLANQRYSICVRKEQGFCSICYTQCNTASPQGSFSVFHGTAATFGALTSATGTCQNDFITIPCGQATTTAATACTMERFCGGTLATTAGALTGTAVCTTVTPFVVNFFTDANENADFRSGGFCLTYSQSPC
uniref:CUB domain-containing protein n=1 Tax=Argulus foliaceus TaxID=509924 RepID=A0A7R9NGL3_9CRUS